MEPREFVCILGASGSGKSTLMHALSARAPADSGQVFLNNVSLYANFQALKQGIAFVPQQDVLHESLTLREALSLIRHSYGCRRIRRRPGSRPR